MKNSIKIWIVPLILLTGFQAEARDPDVGANDFHLSENVKCLEVRYYDLDPDHKWTNQRWMSHLLWCSEPLSKIDPSIVKKYLKAKPMVTQERNIGNKKSGRLVNAFILDKNNKIWRMDEIDDVLKQLGEIDTPAEARLVLWMHGHPGGSRYHKTAKGYTIDIELMEWGPEKDVIGAGGIAEFCTEGRKVVKRALIDKGGKIVSYRTIQKSKKAERSCIHGDPEPIYPEK